MRLEFVNADNSTQYPDGYWYAITGDGGYDAAGTTPINVIATLVEALELALAESKDGKAETGHEDLDQVRQDAGKYRQLLAETAHTQQVIHDDLAEILRVIGLGTHARPISAHQVVIDEILPALARLRQLAERCPKGCAESREHVHRIASTGGQIDAYVQPRRGADDG